MTMAHRVPEYYLLAFKVVQGSYALIWKTLSLCAVQHIVPGRKDCRNFLADSIVQTIHREMISCKACHSSVLFSKKGKVKDVRK